MMNGIGSSCHGAFHAARVAIDVVCDALFVNESLAGVRAALQFRGAEFLQRADQFEKCGRRLAVIGQ